jgi:hypothetical protein
MQRIFILTLIFGSILINYRCKESMQIDNAPNVDEFHSNAKTQRFDRDIIKIDTNNIDDSLIEFQSNYPKLFNLYFKDVLGMDVSEGAVQNNIKSYLTNSMTRGLYDTIHTIYPNLDVVNKEFQSAFKYMQYYFPGFVEPNIYSLVSGFGYQKFLFKDGDKDGIGIALDMYLGSTFPYKTIDPQNPIFSEYITRTFNQDHIVKKSIELIVEEDIVGHPNGVRLLDIMINHGKKLYILDKLLPFKSDTIIVEYSADQLEWVENNEQKIWSFFTEENLLYETNLSKINKYVNPSPSSPGMPIEAPGRTADYIGWQIVKAFMKKNPQTTMEELIKFSDNQGLLEIARYRPK